jgi:hypothetical protein
MNLEFSGLSNSDHFPWAKELVRGELQSSFVQPRPSGVL